MKKYFLILCVLLLVCNIGFAQHTAEVTLAGPGTYITKLGGILTISDTPSFTTATVTGASTLTGVTTHGGNVVSDTDGTDDLGTSTVRWNAIYADELIPNKGADVASIANGMTLGTDGNFFDITGTTNLDSIAAQTAGKEVTLQFDAILTVTDGGNLKLAGNFVTSADDILKLVTDGVDWWEISRSAN